VPSAWNAALPAHGEHLSGVNDPRGGKRVNAPRRVDRDSTNRESRIARTALVGKRLILDEVGVSPAGSLDLTPFQLDGRVDHDDGRVGPVVLRQLDSLQDVIERRGSDGDVDVGVSGCTQWELRTLGDSGQREKRVVNLLADRTPDELPIRLAIATAGLNATALVSMTRSTSFP
jgi:hypothetical protein